MLSLFSYYENQSRSSFLPPWRHAKYKGQTDEYGTQSLRSDFYVYALLYQIKYIPIFIVQK